MVNQIDWEKKKKNWIHSVHTVFNDIKNWCSEKNWKFVETQIFITEECVGSYPVPELRVTTNKGDINLEPVGMNIVGAQGRIDISSWPSLNRMLLIWLEDKWSLNTESRVPWPKPWSKQTFFDIADALTQ